LGGGIHAILNAKKLRYASEYSLYIKALNVGGTRQLQTLQMGLPDRQITASWNKMLRIYMMV
jgi:hypothetical protein